MDPSLIGRRKGLSGLLRVFVFLQGMQLLPRTSFPTLLQYSQTLFCPLCCVPIQAHHIIACLGAVVPKSEVDSFQLASLHAATHLASFNSEFLVLWGLFGEKSPIHNRKLVRARARVDHSHQCPTSQRACLYARDARCFSRKQISRQLY